MRRKTDQANLSMSLSVTSHRLATRAGLRRSESTQHGISNSKEVRRDDSPSADHVMIRRASRIEDALVLEHTRRATPEHRDCASGRVADGLGADVLFGAAVSEIAE